MAFPKLNPRALNVIRESIDHVSRLRIAVSSHADATIVDFGVHAEGGLAAGLKLAQICTSDLADISLTAGTTEFDLPEVSIYTDYPVAACLQSQYAGWKIATADYFAMGSGPIRAIARKEPLFEEFENSEDQSCCVGALESSALPTDSAIGFIREGIGACDELVLAVAPTSSQAGCLQVVARSLETALHKLHDLDFPLDAVISGRGIAPLPPVTADDLEGIGRTNDSILYGSTVNIWVRCEDSLIESLGPKVPSSSSSAHGKPFLTLFKEANHDFYALDPALFSPAVIVFHNLTTGNSFRFGTRVPDILHQSFGL
jgi:methenyltetrahydromethanopterin cyclohydrolase